MSQSNTTQHTPQWCDDCADELRSFCMIIDDTTRDDIEPDKLAAIIACHAPETFGHLPAKVLNVDKYEARIAELEAENARLREALTTIQANLQANQVNGAVWVIEFIPRALRS